MDDLKDQSATLPGDELPEIGLQEEGGLPDLDSLGDEIGLPNLDENGLPDLSVDTMADTLMDLGDGELPDLGGGDLPDLGADDGLPDLGVGDGLPDLNAPSDVGAGDLNLSDLKSPIQATAATASTFGDVQARENPNAAQSLNGASTESVMAFRKIQGIKVRVQVMLGETRLSVSQLTKLTKGEFIQLDTKVGEPVNILANGELIARGEIAVEDDQIPRFGITLTEIIDSSVTSS